MTTLEKTQNWITRLVAKMVNTSPVLYETDQFGTNAMYLQRNVALPAFLQYAGIKYLHQAATNVNDGKETKFLFVIKNTETETVELKIFRNNTHCVVTVMYNESTC